MSIDSPIEYIALISIIIHKAQNDLDMCTKQISTMDQQIHRLLVRIENENFNATDGYQFAMTLKTLRRSRRSAKNLTDQLSLLLGNLDVERIERLAQRMENKDHQQRTLAFLPDAPSQ